MQELGLPQLQQALLYGTLASAAYSDREDHVRRSSLLGWHSRAADRLHCQCS